MKLQAEASGAPGQKENMNAKFENDKSQSIISEGHTKVKETPS
jgi:hypothetical protein